MQIWFCLPDTQNVHYGRPTDYSNSYIFRASDSRLIAIILFKLFPCFKKAFGFTFMLLKSQRSQRVTYAENLHLEIFITNLLFE